MVFADLASEAGGATVACHMFHRSVFIEIFCGLILLTGATESDLFLALYSVIFDQGSKPQKLRLHSIAIFNRFTL